MANQMKLDKLYEQRHKEFERGVHTYWLSQPLLVFFWFTVNFFRGNTISVDL